MELVRFPSHRRFSVRSIFTFVLAALITVLLWTTLASAPVGAADASWNGASLKHDGRDYYLVGTATSGNPLGIPTDSMYYASLETPATPAGSTIQKAHVIYLAPGASPPGNGTASYLTANYDSSSKTYSSPSNVTSITVDTASINAQATTCSIEGIGWIVCPVMNFLAWGMDVVFDMVASFMEVQPVQTGNTNGALYNAWNFMRSVANIAFIIAFLIIIYSQLTSVQVNNYGLKKLLPRLIIAAVAINLSYLICAVAVDISNILGYSLHQVFIDFRNSLLSTGITNPEDVADRLSWTSVVGFVLSGGTAVAAGYIGAVAIAGSVGAAAFLLMPALVGLLMAVLVVLLILAARQALIVILIIIAPLAIVAYLLPNTDQWFGKWRGIFMTMLIFFPAFSVVFGGSQLAGAVIIQNANSINMLILGMIVQVAPLVITPLLLKFSGNLLGGLARLVNNPNKGAIDRTRSWAKGHADQLSAQKRHSLDRNGNPLLDKNGNRRKSRNLVAMHARQLDRRKKLRNDLTSNAEMAGQTDYEASKMYNNGAGGRRDMAVQKATLEADRDAVHGHHTAHVEKARRDTGTLLNKASFAATSNKEFGETEQKNTEAYFNTVRQDRKYAALVGGSALHTSSYKLEASKASLETTENLKAAYYNKERATAGTVLNKTVLSNEASKLTAETAQNNYTAVVEKMKAAPGTTVSIAAQNAQSSKDHLEVAQNQLQAFFDTQRKTVGTGLNTSTIKLEESKSIAEQAKAQLTTYITEQRNTVGGQLHDVTISAETAKQAQQRNEGKLTRIVEEYKAGGERIIDATTGVERVFIDGNDVTGTHQHALADIMRDESARLAAENQGAASAKYVQQEYISTMMNEAATTNTTLTDELLTSAAGIDKNGKTRAQANASTQLGKLQSENLSNNVTLLGDMAEDNGKTIKSLAKELFASQIGEDAKGNPVPQVDQDPSLLEAALEALAQDGDIPTMRKARMRADKIDQNMMTRLFARNAGTMKAKGGFDLQNDPGLAGASEERMNASIAANLGSASAANYPDMKNGEIISTQENIMQIMAAADSSTDPKVREAAQEGLKKSYVQISKALTDPRIRERLGDNLIPAIEIHRALDNRFGHNPDYRVDHDKIDPRTI